MKVFSSNSKGYVQAFVKSIKDNFTFYFGGIREEIWFVRVEDHLFRSRKVFFQDLRPQAPL